MFLLLLATCATFVIGGHLPTPSSGPSSGPQLTDGLLAKQTPYFNDYPETGWTPNPTKAPRPALSGSSLLLQKRDESQVEYNWDDYSGENEWMNSQTCGWFGDAGCKSSLDFYVHTRLSHCIYSLVILIHS